MLSCGTCVESANGLCGSMCNEMNNAGELTGANDLSVRHTKWLCRMIMEGVSCSHS